MSSPSTCFCLWADIPAEAEPAFNEWYNREHVPDRVLGVPGFIQARRFVAVEGKPKYVAFYEVAAPEVFENDRYVAMRRNPDPNSSKFIPRFRNVIRLVGPAIADAAAVKGVAEGVWARLSAYSVAAVPDEARSWSEFTAGMVRKPGIMRARVFRALPRVLDGVVQNMKGHTREGMRGPDRFADVLVMVEGATERQVMDIEAELAGAAAARSGMTLLDTARMQQLMRIAVPT